MGFHLRHGIQRHANDNQQGRSAKVKGHIELAH